MRISRSRLVACATVISTSASFLVHAAGAPAPTATSAPSPSTSASASSDGASALEDAKRLFAEGNELLRVKQWEAALARFQASLKRFPGAAATRNSAICLSELGRFDEALELYEELLARFGDKLEAAEKQQIGEVMALLQKKTASIDVRANVEGVVVVDGRMRGKLPRGPVRVLPGKHQVRILKDGFDTFEQAVELKVGETPVVDAHLRPLAESGRLRIESGSLVGATVFVDGADVGTLPWEGNLKPGAHLFWILGPELGTAPKKIVVLEGQTALVSPDGRPLGAEQRVVADPPSAEIVLDGTVLGKASAQLRLPKGEYVLEVREDGYSAKRSKLVVGEEATSELTIKLEVDKAHPRWGVAKQVDHFGVEVLGGYAYASSFGNDSVAYCKGASPCDGGAAGGFRAAVRGTYEFNLPVQIYLDAGYLSLSRSLTRHLEPSTGTLYDLRDEVRVGGPAVGLGIGYRATIGGGLELVARVGVLGAFLSARDVVTGTVAGNGTVSATTTIGSGTTVRAAAFFAVPELMLTYPIGPLRLGLGVSAPFSLLDGPDLGLAETYPADSGNCVSGAPTSACIPGRSLNSGARAYGRFLTLVPQLGVSMRL